MKKDITVILLTGLATNRGSFGVGDPFPCENEKEAERMVDAGQAKWPKVEAVSNEEFDKLKQSNATLTSELELANKKLSDGGNVPSDAEKQIADLTAELAKVNGEKSEFEKKVETLGKELAAANKKVKAAEAKAKAK